jgi:hypothetical protein
MAARILVYKERFQNVSGPILRGIAKSLHDYLRNFDGDFHFFLRINANIITPFSGILAQKLLLLFAAREPDAEGGALAFAAFQFDVAAVLADDALDDH